MIRPPLLRFSRPPLSLSLSFDVRYSAGIYSYHGNHRKFQKYRCYLLLTRNEVATWFLPERGGLANRAGKGVIKPLKKLFALSALRGFQSGFIMLIINAPNAASRHQNPRIPAGDGAPRQNASAFVNIKNVTPFERYTTTTMPTTTSSSFPTL